MTINATVKSAKARLLGSLTPLPPEFTDWAAIMEPDAARWKAAREAAKDGPKVLIANCAGIDPHVTTVDSLLAVALTLRGADVHILLCDEALPACWISSSHRIPPREFAKVGPSQELCGKCFAPGYALFRPLGLPVHRYGDFLSRSDIQKAADLSSTVPAAEIENFCFDGLKVGEQAYAAALRYYTRGDLRGEPEGEAILRRYLEASLLSVFAVGQLMSKFSFDSVCGIHGMYVPEGVIGEVARSRNVRAVSWNDSYLKQTFIFGLNDTYHRTMLAESIASVETMPWTARMESEIVEYLRSRWYGTHDWIRYTQDWSEDVLSIGAQLGIDFSKPCIGLLTNIIWDAQVHYGGNAFSNMLEWTLETIKYFAKRPDLQLIVRVHPAEVRHSRGSRQLMVDEIKRAIPELPNNVFVIPPDSPMNTYTAMMKCNAVIIYGTKAGVELTSFGIPVIVAGEAWIRNKRLTLDASSPREYFEILDRLPLAERMSDESVQRARKYAYHFFFRRQIPVPVLHKGKNAFSKLEISGIQDLLPGRYPGLDIVCNGIIKGDEFIFPAELYPEKLVTSGKFTASSVELSSDPGRKPLVSVIMAAGDHGDGLAEAVESVYAQNGAGQQFGMEVIVVDNGSTDGRPRLAGRCDGIRYVKPEKTTPMSAVRNAGLRAANGQYLAFLDDDNVWLPERLRSHIAVLEHYPEFGAVYGQTVTTGAGADAVYPEAGAAPAGSVFRAFAIEQFAFPSVLTVRREAFQKAGYFDETLHAMDDYDMLLRLAFFANFAFVAGPAAKARFSDDRTWLARIRRGEHQTELPCILDKAFALLPDDADTSALRRDVIGRWFNKIAHDLDKPETVDLLRSHLLHSIARYPWIMTDRAALNSLVTYASKVLAHALRGGSGFTHPAVSSFCREVKNAQNGGYTESPLQTRRFLGDTLTRTATQMLDQGKLKAAGYAAAWAIRQDVNQIVRQLGSASRRFARALLPV